MSARRWLMRGLVGAGLLAAIGSAAAQAPAQPPAAAATADAPAAVVNGETITMAEVEALLKQLGPSPTALPEATRREQMREVLAALMDELLIDQFLRTNSPAVPPAAIEQKMAELAEALKSQKDSPTVADFCKRTNQTEADLRKNLSRSLHWEGYVASQVSDADLRRYYAENKDFFDKVYVRASHIALCVTPDMPVVEVARRQAQLSALKADLVAGKMTFEAAAAQFSECPISKDRGGDLGYFRRKLDVDEAIARTAFNLPVGQVSDVVQDGWGLHLLKVTDRKSGEASDFDKVKEAVRDLCGAEMRDRLLVQLRLSAKMDVKLP
jgi:parvulin-like peptidyl-prolyl isomerase